MHTKMSSCLDLVPLRAWRHCVRPSELDLSTKVPNARSCHSVLGIQGVRFNAISGVRFSRNLHPDAEHTLSMPFVSDDAHSSGFAAALARWGGMPHGPGESSRPVRHPARTRRQKTDESVYYS